MDAKRKTAQERLEEMRAADSVAARSVARAAPATQERVKIRPRMSQIGARIPEDLHADLREASVRRRNEGREPWQMSDILAEALREWMDRHAD